jgi:PTH1 family peptidyl-tRNA hydrolase
VVFHDELDLAPGKVRVKTGGGTAGHNGLRSIGGQLGPDFMRVRLGIGHPGDKARVTGYVLGDFGSDDREWLDDLLRGIAEGAPALAEGDAPRFLNTVALRTAPPRSSTTAKPASDPAPAPRPAEDDRGPLQRLIDRFR